MQGGSGVIAGSHVTHVAIICDVPRFAVSGLVSGFLGGELDRTLDADQTLTMTGDGPFAFPNPLADGTAFAVEITRQTAAPWQRCDLSGASAMRQGANHDAVRLDCEALSEGIFADGFDA